MEYVTTPNDVKVPQMGLGVYQMMGDEVRVTVPKALEMGYRHIDTANAYFNEVAVGDALAASTVPREEIFLTTKLFPCSYPAVRTMDAIDASLRRLKTDYVDLLLLHQPYGEYLEAWGVLEQALEAGKVRAIGLSNFYDAKLKQVIDTGTVAPQVVQVEMHPRRNQHALKAFLAPYGTVFEGWYPLGHGDAELINMPVFAEIAAAHGKTPSQVILRWHIQEGNVIFPKTTNPEHLRENLDIFDFELTADEMACIAQIEQHPYYEVPDEPAPFYTADYDYDNEQK